MPVTHPRSFALLALGLAVGCDSTDHLEDGGIDDGPDARLEDGAIAPEILAREEIEAFVRAEHEAHEYPALALAVFDQDEVLFTIELGETQGGGDVDEHTRFRIGSISKLLTAVTALSLRDEEKLDLDAQASTIFPELQAELSPAGETPILVRHLLNHSSGIPRDGNQRAIPAVLMRTPTTDDVIESTREIELLFEPGTGFSYSNHAFALMGLAIARKDEGTFEDVVQARVLDPLGMTETTWDYDVVDEDERARGYVLDVTGYVPNEQPLVFGAYAAEGGGVSTVTDLAKFGGWILRTLGPDGDREGDPIDHETLVEATTITNPLEGGGGVGHAFFLYVHPRIGPIVEHSGSTLDFGSDVYLAPEVGLGAVVLNAVGDSVPLACLVFSALDRFSGGELPASCPPFVEPGVDDAIDAIAELLAMPDPEGFEALFSEGFLADVSVDELQDVSESVHEAAGDCTTHRVLKSSDIGATLARLECEEHDVMVWIVLSVEEPRRIEGLLVDVVD